MTPGLDRRRFIQASAVALVAVGWPDTDSSQPERVHQSARDAARFRAAASPTERWITNGDCGCSNDVDCLRRQWYPCDHPPKAFDLHAMGGGCPRCLQIIRSRPDELRSVFGGECRTLDAGYVPSIVYASTKWR